MPLFKGGFKEWVRDLPSTNFRVFLDTTVALTLAIVLVVRVLLTHITLKLAGIEITFAPIPERITLELFLFILAIGGWSYAQFRAKRNSYDPTIPSEQNLQAPPRTPDRYRPSSTGAIT